MEVPRINQPRRIAIPTQPFLVLCQLFDSCYDEWRQQAQPVELVESIAGSLLTGVAFLHEQPSPPSEVNVELDFQQRFYLRKLIEEAVRKLDPSDPRQAKMDAWLKESLSVLSQ
ncbi:hypothetical protein [Brevibacillus massiliensis]|jgi:hypothetical protein|uniref:hypothetical protein n=1 Tax=Brevibacillus massiliensis TaxID=1118054 RepID=UPI000316D8D3|nr:hypothetical protein [Brevibacillus massiliensis]